MQIISHYDDEHNAVGISFIGKLEEQIEIAGNLLVDGSFLRLQGDSVIFETREGEVEYLLMNHNLNNFYDAILVQDRRE